MMTSQKNPSGASSCYRSMDMIEEKSQQELLPMVKEDLNKNNSQNAIDALITGEQAAKDPTDAVIEQDSHTVITLSRRSINHEEKDTLKGCLVDAFDHEEQSLNTEPQGPLLKRKERNSLRGGGPEGGLANSHYSEELLAKLSRYKENKLNDQEIDSQLRLFVEPHVSFNVGDPDNLHNEQNNSEEADGNTDYDEEEEWNSDEGDEAEGNVDEDEENVDEVVENIDEAEENADEGEKVEENSNEREEHQENPFGLILIYKRTS